MLPTWNRDSEPQCGSPDAVEAGRMIAVTASPNAKRFPRSARLLRHADFERVYKQGQRHFSASMTVFYLPRQQEQTRTEVTSSRMPAALGLRVGFTVSRALGGAVQRNRIKRRLREAVRLSRRDCGIAADVVINPKKSVLTAEFTRVAEEVNKAFAVIEQKLGKKDSERSAKQSAKGEERL